MKELPLGVNDYKDIIEGNFIYVDKTKYIYELVRREKGIYFLSETAQEFCVRRKEKDHLSK